MGWVITLDTCEHGLRIDNHSSNPYSLVTPHESENYCFVVVV
jgi:hypothetical protein